MYAFKVVGKDGEGGLVKEKTSLRSNMRLCEFMCVGMCVLAPRQIRHKPSQSVVRKVWVCANFVYVCVDPKQGCLYKSCFSV